MLAQIEKLKLRDTIRDGLSSSAISTKLKVLEVGAINTHLVVIPWLDVKAIDIMSRHPKIEEADFFEVPAEGLYDMVVNSMVINCVIGGLERGKMLRGCFNHLKPGGHLLLALPKRCLNRSQFMNKEKFLKILTKIVGFKLRDFEETPKVSFFTLQRYVIIYYRYIIVMRTLRREYITSYITEYNKGL